MVTLRQKIHKIIRDFNQTWGLELEISRIIFWKQVGAAYRPVHDKGWIYVDGNLKLHEIEQDVLHELGHALIHQYKIHLSKLKFFHADSPKYTMPYITKMHCEEEALPPNGFVSWYATYNGTEDFCETLSAFVSNKYSLKKMHFFENEISIGTQPRLKKKLAEIEKILKSLTVSAHAA